MSLEVPNDFKELREMVSQSSLHTQRQLQAIEGSVSFIKYIATLIISLGLALVIAKYWVPASLLLIYLWSIYSLFSMKKSFKKGSVREAKKAYRKFGKRTFDYGYVWVFRNLKPIIEALGVIYIITVVILILIGIGTLYIEGEFSLVAIIIPVISAILFILPAFMFGNIIRLSAKGVFSNALNEFFSSLRKSQKIRKRKIIILIAAVLLSMFYFVLMIFLPAFSFYLSNFIYYPFKAESLFVIFSLALQFIVIAVLSSYFSSLSAKAEFTNTLTNLENVDAEINRLILSRNITTEDIERVKALYLDAKQYDLRIDEYFKFVPYYFLAMKRTYLLRLQEQV